MGCLNRFSTPFPSQSQFNDLLRKIMYLLRYHSHVSSTPAMAYQFHVYFLLIIILNCTKKRGDNNNIIIAVRSQLKLGKGTLMKVNYYVSLLLCMGLAACSSVESEKIAAIRNGDKQLNCKEIVLEINEAEFYRRRATRNKTPGLTSILMPIGYMSTYASAHDAQALANERVDYLNRIYDIHHCDDLLKVDHAMYKRGSAIQTELVQNQVHATPYTAITMNPQMHNTGLSGNAMAAIPMVPSYQQYPPY